MPFLHSRSIDWSVLTAVYAVWAMWTCTAALAEGKGMPFSESSLHSICLFLTRMDVLFQWFRLCGRVKVAFQSSP